MTDFDKSYIKKALIDMSPDGVSLGVVGEDDTGVQYFIEYENSSKMFKLIFLKTNRSRDYIVIYKNGNIEQSYSRKSLKSVLELIKKYFD